MKFLSKSKKTVYIQAEDYNTISSILTNGQSNFT